MSNTANDVLSRMVLHVDAAAPVTETLDKLRTLLASHVAVIMQGQCLGVVNVHDVYFAASDAKFGDLVDVRPYTPVSDTTSLEELDQLFTDAIVDTRVVHNDQGEFVGVVTRQSLLEGLVKAHGQTGEALPSNEQRQFSDSFEDADELLKRLIEGTASHTGAEFFPSFVSALARVFDSRYILVCEHLDSPVTRVRTLAFWHTDHLNDNFEYDVAGTPCGETSAGKKTFYPNRIQSHFPEDEILADLNAESFCGIPLIDSSGEMIGHLVIADDKEMIKNPLDTPALQIFVSRANAELERKRVEDTLCKSKSRLKTIISNAPIVILSVNLSGDIDLFEGRGLDSVGFQPGQFVGKNYFDIWVDRPHMTASMRKCLTGDIPESTRMQISNRLLETRYSPINDSEGHLTGAITVCVDITECHQAEEAMRNSEARSRALLEGSPVCIKFIDLDSRLQYMSRAGQEQLKITDIEPFYGSTFPPELYPEEWRKPVTEHLERAKSGETCSLECLVLDTEGNEVWFDMTFVPACDENGRILHIIATSVNITERRKAETDSQKHRNELAHVSRISTMGEMATGIAHELNQPLTAISLYSSVANSIAERLNSGENELKKTLDKLKDQAIRAGEIVRRLRGFVNKSETMHVQAQLNAIVQDVATFVEPDIRQAEATLVLKLDDSSPNVLVDEIQIQQVLVNLIRNALDAMHETPTSQRAVTISTRVHYNGQVELTVSDAGTGLTPDELEQVFDTFFSTKQNGMGMGLPISRSIIESHGGKLWSKTNIGLGASFGFTIPLEDAHEPERGPIVFIVDDEAVIRDALSLIVQAMGLSVKCFSSATEFLGFMAPYDLSRPTFVITDVQMPNINGIEFLKQLKTMNKELPVMLMTGHGTTALKHQAEELGAVAFLEKPFQPAEIQAIITKSLKLNTEDAAAA